MQIALWSLATPLLSAPDEPEHIITAAADAHGQIIKSQSFLTKSPYANVTVAKTFADGELESFCFAMNPYYKASSCGFPETQCNQLVSIKTPCRLTPHSDSGIVKTATYTGNYPPLYYLIVGLPSLVSSKATTMYFMRFMSAILSAVFIAVSFYALYKWSTKPLMIAGAYLALTPTALYIMGTVNPSSLEIASALCLWVTGLLIVTENHSKIPRQLLLSALVSAMALALTRASGPLWCIAIIAIVAFMARRRDLRIVKTKPFIYGAIALGLCLITALTWISREHTAIVLPATPYPWSVSSVAVAESIFGKTSIYINAMIGLLGWNNVPVPMVTVALSVICTGCFAVLALSSLSKRNWRQVLALLATTTLVVCVPVVYTVTHAHIYGDIVQGRYLLPGAIGIILISAALAGKNLTSSLPIATTIILSVAIANIFAFIWVLRQYIRGEGQFNAVSHIHELWLPPIPAKLLVVFFILVNAAIAWCLRATLPRVERNVVG